MIFGLSAEKALLAVAELSSSEKMYRLWHQSRWNEVTSAGSTKLKPRKVIESAEDSGHEDNESIMDSKRKKKKRKKKIRKENKTWKENDNEVQNYLTKMKAEALLQIMNLRKGPKRKAQEKISRSASESSDSDENDHKKENKES